MSSLTDDGLLLVAFCVFAVSLETREAQAAEEQAILSFSLNHVESGEVFVVIRDGDVLMERKDLEAAGLKGFTASEVLSDGRALVSLVSVRPSLRYEIDEEEATLRVHAPPELFPPQHLDLSGVPPEVSYEQKPSAFLSYAPQVRLPSAAPATASVFFEAGVAESNRLYYSSVSAEPDLGVTRGLTNVNFDDRARLRRLTLGDTSVSAGPIGGSAVVGGITFTRDFGLDPYLDRSPSLRFASSTDVPATVDVFVNGILVRSEEIQPGTFTLDNIRGLAGSGTVRYVVRDAVGRERSHLRPYYIGPSVLAKGIDDYAVSAGLPRDTASGESFSYLSPSLISYYRRGITDFLTLGARAEARWDRVSGGTVVAVSTNAGVLELETGASAASMGTTGDAAVLAYEYMSPKLAAGASFRLQSERYATISLDPRSDRSIGQVVTSVSVPVGRRASFTALHTLDVRRDTPTYARVSGIAQTQLTRELSLSAQLALVTLEPPSSWWDSFVSLTWTPAAKVFATAGARTTAGTTGVNLQVTRPASQGEDWSVDGALDVATTTRASIRSRLQTTTSTISTYFDHSPGLASLSIEPAGSIVWIQDGGFFLSRPVYDSFALVRVPKVEGVRVYMNSQEAGTTDDDGVAIVPSMSAHQPTQIKLATEDVPLDYMLEQDSVFVAPPRRGAAYVEFPATRVHYFRGRLLLSKGGVEVEADQGDFVVKNRGGELVSAIGKGGVFELEGLTPGIHEAVILFKEDRCAFSFEVAETDAMLVDLGTLRCALK